MKLATNEQMAQVVKIAVREFGIPGIVLMENAGFAMLHEIVKDFPPSSRIVILCGNGNNGGDGFVLARHLHQRGYGLHIFHVGYPEHLIGDSEINYKIVSKLKIPMSQIHNEKELQELFIELGRCNLVVDCLIGTGLFASANGVDAKIIQAVNEATCKVYSVDIPSGVGGNDGRIGSCAIRADKTITFSLPKVGNLLFPGAEYNGELVIRDIGIPQEVINEVPMTYEVITQKMVVDMIPKRDRTSHKGYYGKARMIAGSMSMAGAAILTTKAALRSGLGMARLYVPDSINHIMKTAVPELITIPFQELRKGVIGINHIDTILKDAPDSDVFAIGPGCGISFELEEIVKNIIEKVSSPIILDADALNVLAKDVNVLKLKQSPIIITPHMGEMSRLTGKPLEEIIENPVFTARNFAVEWQIYVVLKSARTVVATPEGNVYVNINGNSGMSTAGTGDVLTGIITGMVGQGLTPLQAAIVGVFVHGMTGDRVAERLGEHGLLAGDLVESLPYTLKELLGR